MTTTVRRPPRDHASALAPTELRYLVLAAQREGNRALVRLLADLQLTPSQAEILLVLDEYGPVTLRALGELIVCEAGSPSRIVEVLVQRGLIERSSSPHDRRAVQLGVAAEAKQLIPQLRAVEENLDSYATSLLTGEEQAVLGRALRKYLAGTPSADVLERRFSAKRAED
ncbi:MarR family transcriptional regulator [Sinomonas sp. ASV486]|uniref:MarR family winged helix-turn-helix transcriptional regulator n=1 Tax=Sinomonas sp. ASV486 TaxID=3051170 RepID=UPI0027DAE8D4|nr:MarR family transcriptional regulator [Sinomonas sp. ASV486]MDQ4488916.1 MarR family transcriptional regulator [Sinomonas sp. ASV486]